MSHEFRTPVNSIQALARLLLERTDGELTAEQERQVAFIRKAADSLSELVNDLLDLAKVEAGKIVVTPVDFEVANLFGALRGMLRPLLANESLNLVFEEPEGIPPLHTDEGKVSQILRNFISNALKFTERGEVRVSAQLVPGSDLVRFAVADTGIGIALEDQQRIFQEFTQVDSPIQRRVKGTGLGLPLCRKLAELLGGEVSVVSQPGEGSTFTATIPMMHHGAAHRAPPAFAFDPDRVPVLVIEDSAEAMLVYEKQLTPAGFQVLPARSLREAREALAAVRPKAVILDILLHGEDTWRFLLEFKRQEETRSIPVLVVTTVDDRSKGMALGADEYCVKPLERTELVQRLTRLTGRDVKRVLVVDDEEVSRYVIRHHIIAHERVVLEASSGAEAMQVARSQQPHVIMLDLFMPDTDGFAMLRQLKSDPATRDIPVIIVTSMHLGQADQRELLQMASGIITKDRLSRERAIAAIDEAIRLAAAT
jgi:CheY-like chemotaxis protein